MDARLLTWHKTTLMMALLLIASSGAIFGAMKARASPTILRVPTMYPTIQSAVDAAHDGDTVFVYNGTYINQTVIIENKKVSLIGQNALTTIIDGVGTSFPIIHVSNASDLVIGNLSVQNGTFGFGSYGISTYRSSNITIMNNIVRSTYYGIVLNNSTACRILDNRISDSYGAGITLRGTSSSNEVVGNTFAANPDGIYIEEGSSSNIFYRNNIINNTRQWNIFPPAPTLWDNGAEGNYWSDYEGVDDGSDGRDAGDGIGDTSLPHLGVDSHPLVDRWNQTRLYAANSHQVVVNCNYTLASFAFNDTLNMISFVITGPAGWMGYCNVTIPKALLYPESPLEHWIVNVGTNLVPVANESLDESTLVSFTYTLGATMPSHRVRIRTGNLPPAASFSYSPASPSVGVGVGFNASGSTDPDGYVAEYQWDFADGAAQVTTEPTTTHRFGHVGIYNVTLTVVDGDGGEDEANQVLSVGKGATQIVIDAPPSLNVEEPLTVTAALLDGDGLPLASKQVEIKVSDGDVDFSENVTTSPSGIAAATLSLNVSGQYVIRASYLGSIDYSSSESNASLVVSLQATSLELQAPENATQGREVELTATLLNDDGSPMDNATVEFHVHNGTAWQLLGSSQTNQGGTATLHHTPMQTGSFILRASYGGDEKHEPSTSIEQSFTVAASEVDYTLIIVSAAAIASAAIILFLVFTRRKGKSSQSG